LRSVRILFEETIPASILYTNQVFF